MCVFIHAHTVDTLFYLVVVSSSWFLVSRPQGLKLGIQYIQQLLNQSDRRANISSLDPTPSVVHQLASYVGSIFPTLYLHINTQTPNCSNVLTRTTTTTIHMLCTQNPQLDVFSVIRFPSSLPALPASL